jgi:hypothetical protein
MEDGLDDLAELAVRAVDADDFVLVVGKRLWRKVPETLRPTARRLPRMWLDSLRPPLGSNGPAGPWHEPPQTAL